MRQQWKPSNKNVNTSKLKNNLDRQIRDSEDFMNLPELKMSHQQSQSSDKKKTDSGKKGRAESSKLQKWDLPVRPVKVQKSKEVQKPSQQFVECFSKLDKDGLDFLRQSISRREQFGDFNQRKFEVEEELECGSVQSDKSIQDEIEEEIAGSCGGGGKEDSPEIIDEIINEEIQRTETQLQPIRQMQNKEKQYIVKKARPISAKVENTVQNKVFKVTKGKDSTPSSGFSYQKNTGNKSNQNQSFSVGKTQDSFEAPQTSLMTGANLFQSNKGVNQKKKQKQLYPIKETTTETNENKLSKQNMQQVIGILKFMQELNKNQQDQLVKAIETMDEGDISEEMLSELLKNKSSTDKIQQDIEEKRELKEQKPIGFKLNFNSAYKEEQQQQEYFEEKKEQLVFQKKKKKESSRFMNEEIEERELIVEEDNRMKCVIRVISTWGCVIHAGLTEVEAFDEEGNKIELHEHDIFIKNSKNYNQTSKLLQLINKFRIKKSNQWNNKNDRCEQYVICLHAGSTKLS